MYKVVAKGRAEEQSSEENHNKNNIMVLLESQTVIISFLEAQGRLNLGGMKVKL